MLRNRYAFALATIMFFHPTRAPAQGADPQAQLWDAAISGDTLAMATALRQGAVIDSLDTRQNPNGRRPLNWAAWYNRVPAIQFLLAHGARLEARNRTGFTPLHHAAESGSVDALRALLKAGADPQAANAAGRFPIETARDKGHLGAVMVLDAAIRSRKSNQQ